MPIIRAPRPERNFYMLDKTISEDKRLSWAARGLLVFLLGKPDHWRVSVPALINETTAAQKSTGRDAVYKLLSELIDTGYARRDKHANGAIDYTVSEPNTENPDVGQKPLPENPDTENPDTEKPDVLVSTDKAVRIEKAASAEILPAPSENENPNNSTGLLRTKQTLKIFLERCKAEGVKAIPENDPIFTYADTIGLSEKMMALCWFSFKARFLEQSSTQKDWRAHYRNAVKQNWFKLWYIGNDGVAGLTTVGKQTLLEMQAMRGGA